MIQNKGRVAVPTSSSFVDTSVVSGLASLGGVQIARRNTLPADSIRTIRFAVSISDNASTIKNSESLSAADAVSAFKVSTVNINAHTDSVRKSKTVGTTCAAVIAISNTVANNTGAVDQGEDAVTNLATCEGIVETPINKAGVR